MFNFIYGSRGSGKTTEIIKLSSKNNVPILCRRDSNVKLLKALADRMGIKIPEPISLYKLRQMQVSSNFDNNYKIPSKVYVDDAESILKHLLGTEVVGVTMDTTKVKTKRTVYKDNIVDRIKKEILSKKKI